MNWHPILDGELAATATDAVAAIARDLETPRPLDRAADHALFWAYYAAAVDTPAVDAAYDAAVARLEAELEAGYHDLALYGGWSGAGFAVTHISDDSSALEALDDLVDRRLATDAVRTGEYDLIGGLAGWAVYLLERVSAADAPIARRALDRIVDHLAAMAVAGPDGVSWRTGPLLLPAHQRERWPDGYDNCGLAHGVPGAIAVLGRIAALPDPPPAAASLCARATAWLYAQRLPPHPRGRFPSAVDGPRRDRGRTAWCYGDPGVAIATWAAAVRTGGATADAEATLLDCATRAPADSGVIDAALCHGAIGLAHLFNRGYQRTRDGRYADAARAWFAHGLAMRRPGEGIGGFFAWSTRSATETQAWTPRTDLLEGGTGIGLALLAALGDEPPEWDRMLACDLPPA